MNGVLQVETWPIERLIEYARNPRKNDDQVDRMVAAIREFGFRIPIVAKSDGLVVDGHLRLKAARKLGLAEEGLVRAGCACYTTADEVSRLVSGVRDLVSGAI